MPIVGHLEELRQRLFKSLAMILVSSLVAFGYHERLFAWLMHPARHVPLLMTAPGEAFKVVLVVSLYAGVALALPGVLYQGIAFVAPGLKPSERHWLVPMLASSAALFALGAYFSYSALIPNGLRFLLAFAPSSVHPMLSLREYVSFACSLIFVGGLLCQLPIVLISLGWMGLVSSSKLAGWRRYALLAAFGIGAVASPSADLFTQVAMALLLALLYEASLLVLRMTGR